MTEHRRRRIIYNDDGDTRYNAGQNGPEAFLADRFDWCKGAQVDSYFWCVGNGEEPAWGKPDPLALGDAEAVIAGAARDAGMEIFASLRMNDVHDGAAEKLTYPLKVERPDLLLGPKRTYPVGSVMYFHWSALDYAREEVRRHRLEHIEKICSNYDWDGLELDFCRHMLYFKLGQAHEHLDTMTAFVGDVRALLDQIAERRGRPYLLAVRVPDTIEHARRIGLDIEQWLSRGCVDLLIGGAGYCPYSARFSEFVALGHRFDVPVYPCINGSVASPSNTGDEINRERLRAMASNLWYEGADGIYIFNLFVSVDEMESEAPGVYMVLNEIGEPGTLSSLDKLYQPECLRQWAHVQYTAPPFPLPVRVIDCAPVPLKIGDPLERAARQGRLQRMTLRLRVTDILDEENIAVQINDKCVEVRRAGTESLERIGVFTTGGGTWFEGKVDAPPLKYGDNTVRVVPSAGCWGKDTTAVQDIQLLVRYR